MIDDAGKQTIYLFLSMYPNPTKLRKIHPCLGPISGSWSNICSQNKCPFIAFQIIFMRFSKIPDHFMQGMEINAAGNMMTTPFLKLT
jgi:hypothetical protein